MSNDTDHYHGVLLEEIRDDVKRLGEAVGGLSGLPRKVDAIDERLKNVESDVKVVKAVVTDLSQHHNKLEKRVTKLEQV